MFASEACAGTCKSEAPFMCSTIRQATASPTNVRYGWKGQPRTRVKTYYKHSKITEVKGVITLDPASLLLRQRRRKKSFMRLPPPPSSPCRRRAPAPSAPSSNPRRHRTLEASRPRS